MAKKKAGKKRSQADQPVDFESALAEVEQIVSQLERGDLDLTEALEKYQRGIGRLKSCHSILDAAQRRVTQLSGFDEDGNPVSEPLPESGQPAQAGESSELGGGLAGPQQSTVDDSPGLF